MPSVDLTIIVQNEGSVLLRYNDSRGQHERTGRLIPDSIAQFTIKRMNAWINFGLLISQTTSTRDALDPEDLKAIGLNLYRILLSDPEIEIRFRDLYDDLTRDRAKQTATADDRMRLKLVFEEEAADLGELPWEFLYIPEKSITGKSVSKDLPRGFFFGERDYLILTRYSPPPPGTEKGFDIGEQSLKIMLAVYTGFSGMGVIGAAEVGIVKAGMQEISGVTILSEARNLSYEQFKRRLSDEKPHIVHFIGHGSAGQITLAYGEDDEEDTLGKQPSDGPRVRWLNAQEFRRLFEYPGKPRLVFLQACNGSASPTNSLSCAQELIQAGVPAVIAMQHSIRSRDAALFGQVFYQNLAKGADVDEAVRAGRHVLGDPSYNHPKFGTPVVCLRTEDRLVSLKNIGKEQEPPVTEARVPAQGSPSTVRAHTSITTARVAEKPANPSSPHTI